MVYLEQFRFPDAEVEFDFFLRQKRTCYDTYYPFQILSKHRFEQIDFEPVTTTDEYFVKYDMPTTFTVRGETVIVESEQLAAALLRLPEKRREVLFLRYYLGYSDTEIGRLFGVCRSTIFRRRKRSLRFIRKELEALEDEE